MPPTVPVLSRVPTHGERTRYVTERRNDSQPKVHPTQRDEQNLADLQRTFTEFSETEHTEYAEPHSTLDKYFREHRVKDVAGKPLSRLGVCFKNLSTWGVRNEHAQVKTLAHAVWRTCTFQDVYEWTIKRWIALPKLQDGRPLINDFSGVVRSGEIMLYVPLLFRHFELNPDIDFFFGKSIGTSRCRLFDVFANHSKSPLLLFGRDWIA